MSGELHNTFPMILAEAGPILGWGAVDVPLMLALPVLLVLSGFFSGSETALFGLTEAQRMSFRRAHPLAGRAVDALLEDQRMLLITILLGNTTVNVLYFVISSVLMMRSSTGPLGEILIGVAFLMIIVLGGEIGPKMLATSRQTSVVTAAAPILLTLHRAIWPIRVVLAEAVIGPLHRLTAPSTMPEQLSDEELRALLDISGREGLIDSEEQRMLRDVLAMRRLRVRDVMTPRVRMVTLPANATREDVVALVRESRLTKIPVYRENLEHILGFLHVKRFLMDESAGAVTDRAVMTRAYFVPDIASLDQLLETLRRARSQSAIVVNEYGGTEGIVAIEDVVEEVIGDIMDIDEPVVEPPRLIGLGQWRVSGDMSLHEWAEAYEVDLSEARASTVSGLVTERLGWTPKIGDAVEVGNLLIQVESTDGSRVRSAVVTQLPELPDAREAPGREGEPREEPPA